MTQAVLRERLRQSNNLTMIIKRLDRLEELRSKVARKGVKTQAEQAALIEERMLIKTDLDSRFRLLGKYLPDLRSIDLADQDGNSMVTMVAQAWAEALQDGGGD